MYTTKQESYLASRMKVVRSSKLVGVLWGCSLRDGVIVHGARSGWQESDKLIVKWSRSFENEFWDRRNPRYLPPLVLPTYDIFSYDPPTDELLPWRSYMQLRNMFSNGVTSASHHPSRRKNRHPQFCGRMFPLDMNKQEIRSWHEQKNTYWCFYQPEWA